MVLPDILKCGCPQGRLF